MAFKQNSPGCPCCDICTLIDLDFSESAHLSEFTFDAEEFEWTVADGKLKTSDADALIQLVNNTNREEQIVTIVATLVNEGDSILVRFGWNTTTGSYLWARWTAGAYDDTKPNLSYCGTLEIGDYNTTDGETVLQGPWHVRGAHKTTTMQLRVCYDGLFASAKLSPASGTATSRNSDTIRIAAPRDFTHPGGKVVGLETGQAADYEIDSFKVEYQGEPGNCPRCDRCQMVDGATRRTYYDGDPAVWEKSCMWHDIAAGWEQHQDDNWLETDVADAVAEYGKTYSAWTEERAFIFTFNVTTSPNDIWRLVFWRVNANNYYYLDINATACNVYKVVAGASTLLGAAPTTSKRVDGFYERALYLRDGRITVTGTTFSGGTATTTGKEFFEAAPASASTIRIQSTTITASGYVYFSLAEESCKTFNRACRACLEASVQDGLPEEMEIVVTGNTHNSQINGTYIASLVQFYEDYCHGLAYTTTSRVCRWRVLPAPAGFWEMLLVVDRDSGKIIFYAITGDAWPDFPTWGYSANQNADRSCIFDGFQLNPGAFLTNCQPDESPADETGGVCYITAVEPEDD